MDEDSSSDNWIRRLGKSLTGGPRSLTEFREYLSDAIDQDVLDTDASSMILGVLETSDTQVRDIMIPRAQMAVLESDWTLDEILTVVVESGHSRFPVVGESRDQVIGILLAKDILRYNRSDTDEKFDLNLLLRPAAFIPESKRVNVLLKDFRGSRNHMAIVVDEYGGVAGLVTIEDVLEIIVGDIDDEYDEAEGAPILKQDEKRFLVNALTPIDDFNAYFKTDFSDEEFDTIGGLVTHRFGHMPRRGESVRLGNLNVSVQRADSRRVHLVQVTLGTAVDA